MNKLLYTAAFLFLVSTLSSCFKDYEERYLFKENRIEFNDAVINSNASGKTFPRLTPLKSDAGVVQYRVNMTGEQKGHDRTVNFRVVPEETSAREGIDYRLPNGTSFVIPANSSFGWIEVEVLPGGSGSPYLVLELMPTDDIKVMDRYHQIGLQILYPYLPPNPNDIEIINDMRYFKNFTIGGNTNTSIGNYMDLQTGYAYTASGAAKYQENIDFIMMRSEAGTQFNIIPPSSSAVTAWGSSKPVADWDVRNAGQLMRLPNPSSVEMDLFENAQSKADLDAAYDYYLANIADRPDYSLTNDGPSTRLRLVDTGCLVAFRSTDRDVIALIYIEESDVRSAGYLKGRMKSAGEGNL